MNEQLRDKLALTETGVAMTFNLSEACEYLCIERKEFDQFNESRLGPSDLIFDGHPARLNINGLPYFTREVLDAWKTSIYDHLIGRGGDVLRRIRRVAVALSE